MKFALLSLVTLLFTHASAMADPIQFQTRDHEYSRFPSQMQAIVDGEERVLSEYLGEVLECRLVHLTFNNLKSPGLFSKGSYHLTLSALCNKSFSDFKVNVTYGYSNGEPFWLKLSFNLNGQPVVKRFNFAESDS